MAGSKHAGAKNELIAVLWLLGEGYEVFRNVSAHGPMDIVAIRGAELLKVDVKSATYGKEGRRVMCLLDESQRNAGIYALHVFPDGKCFVEYDPMARRNKFCVKCGTPYKAEKQEHLYCSPECRPSFIVRTRKNKPHKPRQGIGEVIYFPEQEEA